MRSGESEKGGDNAIMLIDNDLVDGRHDIIRVSVRSVILLANWRFEIFKMLSPKVMGQCQGDDLSKRQFFLIRNAAMIIHIDLVVVR